MKRALWALPLVLAVAAGILLFVNQQHDADVEAAADARTEVTSHVQQLLTYDHREIDADLDRESDWLTGGFADEYVALVTDKIAPAARKAKVSTDAKVSASGVVSSEQDEVELLVFVNVTTRSSELDAPRVSGSRLQVTAELVDGEWRISALDPV